MTHLDIWIGFATVVTVLVFASIVAGSLVAG